MQFPNLDQEAESGGIAFAGSDVEPPLWLEASVAARVAAWLTAVAKTYSRHVTHLTYIFCSDDELHQMNIEYLDHDTLTDIITFDLRDEGSPADSSVEANVTLPHTTTSKSARPSPLEGECYISVDRVADNAVGFGESPQQEMLRVMLHGLLHLCGLGDKTAAQQRAMRQAEQQGLDLWERMRGEF